MKTYLAQRPLDDAQSRGDCRVFVQSDSGIRPLRHVVHHSPADLVRKAEEPGSGGARERNPPCTAPLTSAEIAAWLAAQEAER